MLEVHRDAALKTRRPKRRTAPVTIITIDPLVMGLAQDIAECPCQIKIQPDGSALVSNRCRHS
jgi:hypothetical protein